MSRRLSITLVSTSDPIPGFLFLVAVGAHSLECGRQQAMCTGWSWRCSPTSFLEPSRP